MDTDAMKLNAALLKQLREERAWSQEHLAALSGLGLRTIQRAEADGNASAETRMALAAAFDIDVTRLNAPATPQPSVPPQSRQISQQSFVILRYLVCSALFLAVDLGQHGHLTWAQWPVAIWGLAVISNWIRRRHVRA